MHDLRAVPRWSKTAVVVVLVVFGLVLVVSVFGLWAFTSDREARRRALREDARNHAHDLLDAIQQTVNRRLEGLLDRASKVDSDQRLQGIRSSPIHGPLIREIFRRDAEGAIRWIDEDYRLHDSPERIELQAEWQYNQRDFGQALLEEATRTRDREGPAAALPIWEKLALGFGLRVSRTEDDPRPVADGVAYAVEMLRCAADAAEVRGDAWDYEARRDTRDALLRAAEIEALNRSREGLKQPYLDYKLGELERESEHLLARVPVGLREELKRELERFHTHRDFVSNTMKQAMLVAAVRKVESLGRDGAYVIFEEPELLGVITDATRSTLIARLDLRATASLIRENIDHETFRQLGMRAALFRLADDPTLEGADGPEGSLALIDRPFELPFRLAFFRVGEPQGDPGGLTDLLFWVVIALAVAGLVTGGYVLVRLLTREIRLARLKADFVSNLSHELKTPITSISIFTEMLDEGKITDADDQAEAFAVLNQESQRLQRLVARMIDVARGEARRTPYDLGPGDLNRPVLEAATRFRRIVTEDGMDLAVTLFPQPLPVRLDAQAMDDVVTNLLSNAWKYKRGDGARIAVRTARRGRHAELVVSDDGLGIPRAERRRVFEMFYRAEQYLTHPVAGTGLGLALVRSVVRAHGGTVRIESGEGGRGSTFRLRFPLEPSGVAAAEAGAPGPAGGDSAPNAPAHGKVNETRAARDAAVRSQASNPGAPS